MTSPSSGVSSGNTVASSLSGNTFVPNSAVIPVQSTLGTALPINPGNGNEPSSAANFSQYLPPGVYTNPQPGPQLAVNSNIPNAVGIVGQSVGYMTFVQTVLINPDIQGVLPTVNVSTTTAGAPGQNAIQVFGTQGAPTGGTFSISYGGSTTAALPYNATVEEVQFALNGLTALAPQGFIPDVQKVTLTGAPTGGTFTLAFGGQITSSLPYNATGAQVQTALLALSSLGPALGGVSETRQVSLSGSPTGGTFSLTFGSDTTGPIAYNATSTTVANALNDLTSVTSAGGVSVTGNAGGPWAVTFDTQGPISSSLSIDPSNLTGGTSPSGTVTVTQQGALGEAPLSVTGTAGGPWTVTFGATMPGKQSTITGDTGALTGATGSLGISSAHMNANPSGGVPAVSVTHAAGHLIGVPSTGSVGSTGELDPGPFEVQFVGAQANTPQPSLTFNYENLSGGTNPSIVLAQIQTGHAPTNAVQTITVNATSGTFTLTWGTNTTSPLAYNSSATTVQSALQLPGMLGNSGCTVTGPPGGPYVVTFTGANSGIAQPLLVATPASSISPSNTQTLAQQGINVGSVVVTNPNSGVAYRLNSDYVVVNVGGTNGTSNALYAIQRVTNGSLSPGDYIQVSYNYTNPAYYSPYLFYSYRDVVQAYGQPFDLTTGAIQSGLSLAAKFAFLNGASQVVCAAVQPTVPVTGSNGTTTLTADAGDYETALGMLADQAVVAVVCADTGLQEVQVLLQAHVDQQSNSRFERRGIVGPDGTVAAVPASQRIIDAKEMDDSRIMYVSPSTFNYFSTELNQQIVLGGQYMAAALAGLTCAQSFAMPLTRKTVAGFSGVNELEQTGQMDLEASNGICVVWKNRNNIIQVRHGLSTKPDSLITREWNIIGQQDAMIYTLRAYLESDNLIGQPIYAYTMMNVMGSAEAALQQLVTNGLIVDYTSLSVQQMATNPDVLEVSFNWLPAFPLNYIVCTFSISLTSGNVTTNTGTGANTENITNAQQTAGTIGTQIASTINTANSILPTTTLGDGATGAISNTVPSPQGGN